MEEYIDDSGDLISSRGVAFSLRLEYLAVDFLSPSDSLALEEAKQKAEEITKLGFWWEGLEDAATVPSCCVCAFENTLPCAASTGMGVTSPRPLGGYPEP